MCLGLLLALMLSVGLMACGKEEDGEDQALTQPVPRKLVANFALLRTPPDGIPPDVRRILSVPVPGMRWDLARRIPVSLPGAYWLAPGTEALCIVATTPESPAVGTVCAKVNQALRQGVTNASLDPTSGRRVILGVVPDGTRTALVRTDAATASASVHRGSFVLRDSVDGPPDEVTLR